MIEHRKNEILIHQAEDGSVITEVRFGEETVWLSQVQIAELLEQTLAHQAVGEEKAAQLLYFIFKNHAFSDGNKRIAAAIFLYFMARSRHVVSG